MTEPHITNIRRCRQCREAGHDIRNCPLFERIHQEGLRDYEQWIHHCLVDYHFCNKWQYDNPLEDGFANVPPTDVNLLQLFIDNRDQPNPTETVLRRPTTWIQNQPIENLRILGHVYNFPKTEPYKTLSKDDWVVLLHFLLYLEVEKKSTFMHDVKEAVPYLSTSIQCFPALESIYQYIQTIPNILPDLLLTSALRLRPLSERHDRIRELRTNTARNLLLMQQDLNENYREEIGIRRRMNDLRVRRARIENEARRIETGVIRYENEMIMFLKLPPDPPKITFHKYECSEIIDLTSETESEVSCSICYEPTEKKDLVHLECKHEFCAPCMFLTISGKFNERSSELEDCLCPFCRRTIKKIYGENVPYMKSILLAICNKQKLSLNLTRIVGGV